MAEVAKGVVETRCAASSKNDPGKREQKKKKKPKLIREFRVNIRTEKRIISSLCYVAEERKM